MSCITFPPDLLSFRFFRSVVAEFFGTSMFIFTSVGTALVTPTQTALVFGLSTAVVGYSIGPTSGGHINPVVTWTLCLFGHYNVFKGIVLITTQFLATATGFVLVKGLFPIVYHGNIALNSVTHDITTTQAFFLEVIGTSIITFTLFAVAVDPKSNEPMGRAQTIAPLAIGLAVFIAHTSLIPLTNCGINPARSFGAALINNKWSELPIFIFAPLIGGPLGAALHYLPALLTDEVETTIIKINEVGSNTALKVATTETT